MRKRKHPSLLLQRRNLQRPCSKVLLRWLCSLWEKAWSWQSPNKRWTWNQKQGVEITHRKHWQPQTNHRSQLLSVWTSDKVPWQRKLVKIWLFCEGTSSQCRLGCLTVQYQGWRNKKSNDWARLSFDRERPWENSRQNPWPYLILTILWEGEVSQKSLRQG